MTRVSKDFSETVRAYKVSPRSLMQAMAADPDNMEQFLIWKAGCKLIYEARHGEIPPEATDF